MRLKFKKQYDFAHRGVKIEHFAAGQLVETPTDELYRSAIKDRVALDPDEVQPEPAPKPEVKKPVKTKA